MTSYSFSAVDGKRPIKLTAADLPDISAARREAAIIAAALLKDSPMQIWSGDDWSVDVRDQHGLLLFSVIIAGINAPAAMALRAAS